jgi:hypothetical protein
MYSQLIVVAFDLNGYASLKHIFFEEADTKLDLKIVHTFYSVFNLEIFRYLLPHVCLTSNLKFIHLAFLGYISALYPLFLIFFTWLLVELHDRNVRALVWTWRSFHKCFVHLRKGWDTKNDMIDVFITFFLLSYTKCSYQALQLLSSQKVFHYAESDCGDSYYSVRSSVDLSITYFNNAQLLFAIPAMLIFFVFNILLPLLLILYPLKCFRFYLSKCCNNSIVVVVNIFVDKLQNSYRSHLDGGWDMRSFSALYFYLRIGIYLVAAIFSLLLNGIWFSTGFVSLSIAFIIAIVRPYKMIYMSIMDALLLTNYALLCFAMTMDFQHSPIKFFIKAPAIIFILIILVRTFWRVYKLCFHDEQKHKLKVLAHRCCKCCHLGTSLFRDNPSTAVQREAEQPLVQPTSTEIVID